MQDFLEKLYNYEYFGIYLMLAIAILVLIFIVVLFYGKKDKKIREIEATKKLQQIESDAFKEENTAQPVETVTNNVSEMPNNEPEILPEPTNAVQENIQPKENLNQNENINESTNQIENTNQGLEDNTLVFPTMNTEIDNLESSEIPNLEIKEEPNIQELEIPTLNENIEIPDTPIDMMTSNENELVKPSEPVKENNFENTNIIEPVFNIEEFNELPKIEPVVEQEMNLNQNAPKEEDSPFEIKPLLDKVEEKPLVFNDFNTSNDKEDNDIEDMIKEDVFSQVEIPDFNFEPIDKSIVEQEDNSYNNHSTNSTKNLEVFSSVFAPKKEEKEIVKEDLPEKRVETDIPTVDEMAIELPKLKKEAEKELKEEHEDIIEKPVLKDYNLNDLTGETYDLNK